MIIRAPSVKQMSDENSTYLLPVHKPLLFRDVEDFHRNIKFGPRFVRYTAIIVAHNPTFPACHLENISIQEV